MDEAIDANGNYLGPTAASSSAAAAHALSSSGLGGTAMLTDVPSSASLYQHRARAVMERASDDAVMDRRRRLYSYLLGHKGEYASQAKCFVAALSSDLQKKLGYDVHAWSSYSASYHPRNILSNKPTEQGARWSSGANNQMQFLTIKLDKVSVVYTITFGKYHKVHVCNLKEFKVYGGLNPNNMIELLHGGLKNDDEPETFALKHKSNGVTLPIRFIKIVPLMAWGANFNFSIWYVELRGINDSEVMDRVYDNFMQYRENEALRLCLKHFRQRNYMDTFNSLQGRAQIKLEEPWISNLHTQLVLHGDFVAVEALLTEGAHSGIFNEHIAECAYKAVWRRLYPDDPALSPPMRGGHQMCIDTDTHKIYLLGGWDGTKDLADFWVYDIQTNLWRCISRDTRREGGPGPRSCHKICFDRVRRHIYTLGRYVDPESRAAASLESDFYRFDVESEQWSLITANTLAEGGPELIYDHQMCMDADKGIIFVFGGRTISPTANDNQYSGLYSYRVEDNSWRVIRTDTSQPEMHICLKSRIGHSMLLHPKDGQLYIFAGQRHKDYLSDFYVYDIETDIVVEMSRDSSKQGGPDAGFTQRATIDIELGELYVLSGLMREKNSAQETVKNSFWVYSIGRDRWSKVYQNENTDSAYWARMHNVEPCPRFAHQLVYDQNTRTQYLFGGNPGETGNPKQRLDDFWELKLMRPSAEDILRRAKFFLRKQRFREMCQSGSSLEALRYLQSELASTVNHSDPTESMEFRALTATLFAKKDKKAGDAMVPIPPSANSSMPDVFQARTQLYDQLLTLLPESMQQPKGNLIDLVQ